MSDKTMIAPTDLYAKIVEAVKADPAIESALLSDFGGTIADRFGVTMPKPGRLVRSGDGFRLTYDGQDYDLGDPRKATPGELNDVELELVSGGKGGGCPSDHDRLGNKDRRPIQPNGPSGESP